jgi:uncharacterized protein DUF6950
MNAELTAFLKESYGRSFQWGERDCGLWVAEWVKRIRGIDPASQFRGHYKTALGCARLIRRHGDLLRLATEAFATVGLTMIEGDETEPGDIACVRAIQGQTLGLVVGSRVAMIVDRGLVSSSANPVLCAWKV